MCARYRPSLVDRLGENFLIVVFALSYTPSACMASIASNWLSCSCSHCARLWNNNNFASLLRNYLRSASMSDSAKIEKNETKKNTLNFVIKVLANTRYIIILYVQSTHNSFFIDIAIRAVLCTSQMVNNDLITFGDNNKCCLFLAAKNVCACASKRTSERARMCVWVSSQ